MAQQATQHLYSIHVKQSFSSWGSCSSDPDFDYADVKLIFGEQTIEKHITSTDLNSEQEFDEIFKNIYQSKDLSSLKWGNNSLTKIEVHTNANDIKNDHNLYYNFELNELSIGKSAKSQEASDPCNNFISNNREGYTMSTMIYIDDPIYLSYNGENNYILDYEVLTIQVGNYYENGHTTKPVLEVAPFGTNDWEPLKNVIIKPESTIYLPYETIAGKKNVAGSHFYEWMGKPLQFRIVKTLKNNQKTTGNIITDIRFNPEGLQYTILHTDRNYCDDIITYVKLENSDDAGFLDTSLFFWRVRIGDIFYDCEMHETTESDMISGANTYRISLSSSGMPQDPFTNSSVAIEGIMQLEVLSSSTKACEKTFTIPPKPKAISVSQKPPLDTINGVAYHIPSMNNPYVLLEIDELDEPYLRKPYKVFEGSNELATITELPQAYENMTQSQKDSVNEIFNAEFDQLTEKPSNIYKNYFDIKLKEWAEQHSETGDPLYLKVGMEPKLISGTASYLFLSDYDNERTNVYLSRIGDANSTKLTTTNKVYNRSSTFVVHPNGNEYFYVYVNGTTTRTFALYRASVSGGTGVQISTYFEAIWDVVLSSDNSYIYFRGVYNNIQGIYRIPAGNNIVNTATKLADAGWGWNALKMSHAGNFLLYKDVDWDVCKYNLQTNTTNKIVDLYYGTFNIAPNDQFILYSDNAFSGRSHIFKAPIGSSINNGIQITNDVFGGEHNIYIFKNSAEYLFADGSRFSSELGEGTSPKPYLEQYVIRKAPAGNSINNGRILHPDFRSAQKLAIDKNEGLCVYNDPYHPTHPRSLFLFVLDVDKAVETLSDAFYPNMGIAQSWYDDYKATYKEKWLDKRFGVKVSNGIQVNKDQYLKLVDKDGCEYPEFLIHVIAPPNPSFTTSIISNPTDACAQNGTARITYNGGGVPPYVHSEGTLSSIGNQIVVTGLSYGENVVHFNDASGNESTPLTITIGSATRGITSTPALPQTCTPANGRITINVGSMAGTKTYRLINEDTFEKYESSSTANSYTFSNLPAGKYKAEVESGTCFFFKTGIEVASQIFQITSVLPTHATTIGGTGSVSMAFVNRTNNVSWISGVPSVFNTSENKNSISYSGVVPYTYNYTARHIDNSSRTCNVSGSFTVEKPSFETKLNIHETDNGLSISASLLNGNSLITPYRFRLLNSSRTEVSVGTNNSSFSATTQTSGSYILNMVYGSNNIDIYTFNYPAASITNNHSITSPTCPGGNGSISLNPAGGIDGSGFTVSTDGVEYTASTTFIVKGGNFGYYIKDENTSNADIGGNPVTINRSLVNFFEVPIQDPAPVNADRVESVDVTCAGLNNGSITIEGLSGGSGNYRYRIDNGSWSNPQIPITGISPGSHNVYLQDNLNNCPIVTLATFTISEPDMIEIDSIRIMQPTCELENGEIYTEVMGGNGYYQFDWTYNGSPFYNSGSLTEDSISYLGNSLRYGFYNLNVTDNKNCNFSYTVELNEYINPEVADVAITDVACYAESNGAVLVLNVNGTNTFDWISIRGLDFDYNDTIYDLANPFNNLPTGRYELSAGDNIGCVSDLIYPLVVNQPNDILSVVVDTIYPVLNVGTASGAIRCTVLGGNVGLKDINLFNASNELVESKSERSQFPVIFKNLFAGNYNLYVEDIKGCSFTSPLQTVIEPQSALGFMVTEKNNALCKAQTGSFIVEAFGGWGDYSFKRASDNAWYPGNSFENLYAGSYMVSVRDKYGAVFTDAIVIHEPKDDLQAQLIDYTAPSCENNGSLLVDLDGGTAPYKLFFDGNTDTTEISTPQDYLLANRPTGNYLLHMTDYNGCKFELETSLSDTELINISEFKLTYPSTSSSGDGTIEAIINGGTPPLSFAWREIFGTSLTETGAILSSVPSNYYELTVSETNGCSVSERVYLPAVSDLALEIIELGHETSYLANNGFAQLRTQLEPLVYIELIDPSGTRILYDVNTPTSDFYEENGNLYFSNLSGGNYHVAVINNLNEKAYAGFEIIPYEQFYIKNILLTHATEIDRANGKISIVVAGGAGNNSFSWQYLDGTTGPLNIMDNEYTSTLSNAVAGNYLFTATDQYNYSISQTVTIEQPALPLDIIITEYRNESCKNYEDAYLTVQASGGWGDYQFKQDVEEYFSNNHTWLNLDVREHYFYIIDKMGTIDSIAFSITEPDYLTASTEFVDSVNCRDASDGNILFNINGGTAPYRFAFQNQANLWFQDTVARNLAEGSYTFLFTDLNNCTGQDTLTIYMPEPDSLLFSKIDVTHTTCNTDNGAITVAMQGGTMPYQYRWTDFSNNTIGTENTVLGLSQNGYYFLDVLDVHNCPQHYEQLISPSTNPLVTEVSTTAALCYGGNTGTANIVDAIAATPYAPYHFTWSNSDTGEFADGYNAGIHSVIIRDTNNCFTEKYFEISQPDSLQIVLTDSKDAHCFGYNDGYIQVQAQGGVGNYQYSWSNGGAGERTDSLYKGTYTLTVTDLNLCTTVQSFEISEPPKVIVDLGEDLKICPGNGINIDGQEFATHQWSDSEGVFSGERFVKLNTKGAYYLEVTNNIGCYAWDTISISIGNDALQAEFLMASEAILGDSIFIYEVSNLTLDSLSWDYSHESFIDITDSELPEYMLQLESLETGIFNIALWAYSGGCMSTTVKQIEIIPNDGSISDSTIIGYKDPLITNLKVYPNPSDGYFSLKVELREPADIKLVFFSVDYGRVIEQRNAYGLDNYELAYQLPGLNTGAYLIMLTAENERKQIKIIIESE